MTRHMQVHCTTYIHQELQSGGFATPDS